MSVPRWGPLAELQTFLQEMGMRHAVYDDDFLGPEAMAFTTRHETPHPADGPGCLLCAPGSHPSRFGGRHSAASRPGNV